MVNVLLANLPQFVMSIMYIFYNAMMTTFLVQREFSHMYKEKRRKPLRVSEPIGIQRGSYFISLPLRYGIPSYVLSGFMHWMISQSLFLARITALKADGSLDLTNSFSTCGYSPIAIFFCESSGYLVLNRAMMSRLTEIRVLSIALRAFPCSHYHTYQFPQVRWYDEDGFNK